MDREIKSFMEALVLCARQDIEEEIENGELSFDDEKVTAYFGSFSSFTIHMPFLSFVIEHCDVGVKLTPEEIIKFKMVMDIFVEKCNEGRKILTED